MDAVNLSSSREVTLVVGPDRDTVTVSALLRGVANTLAPVKARPSVNKEANILSQGGKLTGVQRIFWGLKYASEWAGGRSFLS